jgi:acetyl esterase
VFFHGGGFVLGSIETHDGACRCLADEAGVRVLSAEYRLAPEHPFPAAADDAIAAFNYVAAHALEIGVQPGRIAVGGDSSGGNLAAVVAHAAARGDGPRPAFSLLLYPATDALGKHRSYQLFGRGFRLDDEERDWYRGQYLTTEDLVADPRVSVLHDTQLTGLPPTYVATSGFDPLRDEARPTSSGSATRGCRSFTGATRACCTDSPRGSASIRTPAPPCSMRPECCAPASPSPARSKPGGEDAARVCALSRNAT